MDDAPHYSQTDMINALQIWPDHFKETFVAASEVVILIISTEANDKYFAQMTFLLQLGENMMNENVWVSIKISLKFVRHRPSDKPLSESMMVRLPTHMRHSASMI